MPEATKVWIVGQKVWIVGQWKDTCPHGVVWEFQGVFSTLDAAVSACRDENYFFHEATLDAELPHETVHGQAWIPGAAG